MSKSIQYKVIVRTGPMGYDEYKVYSHSLEEGCLVLNQGYLDNSNGPNEVGIPLGFILGYHTEDIDE